MLLPRAAAIALGIVLVALEIVQNLVFHIGGQAHAVVSLAIVVIAGLGVAPASPAEIRALILKLPLHIATVLTLAAGVLEVVQQTANPTLSPLVHSIIAVVIVGLTAIGIIPVPPIPAAPAPPAGSHARGGHRRA